MTVRELVEELRKYPDDAKVVVLDGWNSGFADISKVGPPVEDDREPIQIIIS